MPTQPAKPATPTIVDPIKVAEAIVDPVQPGNPARGAMHASVRDIVAMASRLLDLDEIAQGAAALLAAAPSLITNPTTADLAGALQGALVQLGYLEPTDAAR
jgi:hypothetical protein